MNLGELKRPSRSIPVGSISALFFVFFIFVTEALLMAATTDRCVEMIVLSLEFFLCSDYLDLH